MILALRFAPPTGPGDVREAHFEPVTSVRLETVCAVANATSDQLTRLLDRPITVDVFEPIVLPSESHYATFGDAIIFRAHGRRCELLVVYRSVDARRIIACAFNEELNESKDALSTLEEQVLERLGRDVAQLCTPLCGEINAFARSFARIEQLKCTTYFELRIRAPIDAVIGIGLSADPNEEIAHQITQEVLLPVGIDVRAVLAQTRMRARSIAELSVGSVVTFDTRLDDDSTLVAGSVRIASGECGLSDNDVMAFHVRPIGATA